MTDRNDKAEIDRLRCQLAEIASDVGYWELVEHDPTLTTRQAVQMRLAEVESQVQRHCELILGIHRLAGGKPGETASDAVMRLRRKAGVPDEVPAWKTRARQALDRS